MVEFFDYPTYQLKNHVEWDERFIIVRGPRFSGKSYFVKTVFDELNVDYIYIDIAEIRKVKASGSKIFQTIKKDLNNQMKYTKTNIPNLKFPYCKFIRCFLEMLEKREKDVYVIFDHAELLHPWSHYSRIFKGEIDHGKYVHLVFVAGSTPELIEKIGVNDPSAPLFGRWEKYVDVHYWGPHETKEYFKLAVPQMSEDEIWSVYELTEGAPQLVMKYAEYRRKMNRVEAMKALEKYVKDKVLEEISDSAWKLRILKAIAVDTGGGGYTSLERIYIRLSKYDEGNIKARFFEVSKTNFIENTVGNIRLKPQILSHIFVK